MKKKVLLKDILFNQTKITQLANEIHRVHRSFRKSDFVRSVVKKFPQLELKARITWIAECLQQFLVDDYKSAIEILMRALPPPNDPQLLDNDFGDFIYAPFAEFVAKFGCNKAHLKISLAALYEITQRFSAEDAIRYFLNAFPQETLKELKSWSKDSHYHVRRLCSEGTRPKLPWSQKINIPATAALPLLDNLFSDKTRYVTRSVANHINDISKTDPNLALATLIKWEKSGKQREGEMDYIIRHALRTLVKQGNPKALKLLGYSANSDVQVAKFRVPKRVKMNSVLEFSFEIRAQTPAKIIVDYTLYFRNKNGEMKNKKVFKLTKLELRSPTPVLITKRHMLREQMTTRTLYRGKHEVEIQVNGKKLLKGSFLLEK
jgi:3-methyladenine DNA glycosylase AlkC